MNAYRISLCGLACVAALACGPATSQALPPSLFKPELILPKVTIEASSAPAPLALARAKDLSQISYQFQGQAKTVSDFISEAKVKSLLVLHDGQIVYQYNKFPNTASTRHQSWSMMKQVLSVLIGAAIQDGYITSVDERMDRYEPKLALNGFRGVTFKQALTMSSGIRYDEVKDRYQLFFDVIGDYLLGARVGLSLDEEVTAGRLSAAYTPGSRYDYASINSQALAWALEAATRMPLADYLQNRLWAPLGMTDSARLLVDRSKRPFAFCCLYATARSYARLGQLYAQNGVWQGRQIIPREWVRLSTTFADAASWTPDKVQREGDVMDLHGFAYHWWPLAGNRGDFTGLGVYGQGLHVLPAQNTVVVRLSDDFDTPGAHAEEAAVMGRAIADALSRD